MTLPLPLRNRLAELVLDALRGDEARAALEMLGRYCRGEALVATALPAGFPGEWFDLRGAGLALKGAHRRFRDELCERVGRAWAVVRDRPLGGEPSLRRALDDAAVLFDARLDFEVHELLEPLWVRAEGPVKEMLQGLIQVAVGYHHLAGGNARGARNLLEEGSAKLLGRRLEGPDLDAFARAVRGTVEAIERLGADAPAKFDWSSVPKFPGRG